MNFIFKELLPMLMLIISSYFLGILGTFGIIFLWIVIVFIFAYGTGRQIELNKSKINYYKIYIFILFIVIILMIIHLIYLRYTSGEKIYKNLLIEDIIYKFKGSRVEYKNTFYFVIASYLISLIYQFVSLISFFFGICENKKKKYGNFSNIIFIITVLLFLFIEVSIIVQWFPMMNK